MMYIYILIEHDWTTRRVDYCYRATQLC